MKRPLFGKVRSISAHAVNAWYCDIRSIKCFYIHRKIIHAINSRSFNNNQHHTMNSGKLYNNVSLSPILKPTCVEIYHITHTHIRRFFYANEHFDKLNKINKLPSSIEWSKREWQTQKISIPQMAWQTTNEMKRNEKKETDSHFFVASIV